MRDALRLLREKQAESLLQDLRDLLADGSVAARRYHGTRMHP